MYLNARMRGVTEVRSSIGIEGGTSITLKLSPTNVVRCKWEKKYEPVNDKKCNEFGTYLSWLISYLKKNYPSTLSLLTCGSFHQILFFFKKAETDEIWSWNATVVNGEWLPFTIINLTLVLNSIYEQFQHYASYRKVSIWNLMDPVEGKQSCLISGFSYRSLPESNPLFFVSLVTRWEREKEIMQV